MSENEKKLTYPWGDTLPESGHLMNVADGIQWLRMPLPFALDHVNLWMLRDEIEGQAGWTIIDTGVARDELKGYWERIFAEELQGLPILRVIVTHMHPDHVGLAGWICDKWQVPLYMTMTDYIVARYWTQPDPSGENTGGPNGKAAADHFASHGLTDPESQEKIAQRANYYPGLVSPLPRRFNRLVHGECVRIGGREWRIIVGYGHAPEHASLYCDDIQVLISGDMVLPRISTNISVFDSEPEANPLPLFLNSLAAYHDLPDDTLVLPSHGRPFKGLHERIGQLLSHHSDRLDDTYSACVNGLTAADLVPVLFKRKLDLHQLSFAMGEALAHLHALWYDGKLRRERGTDGVFRFYAI
ncbi:MBL fold metallo-hydrolase [Paenalcaligenes niemegkensis]|uniref:MBL fold metallo-hydrolase n=1 Tax=Paenalcaligenes niemegkensis TaxID=2895469 RepID=UPI001EE8408F|nr:MBL fold metallo-hydrolase [Paenalcaligenes niemegkensis]MCQ9617887.1 MBL fold metallo-hydrolase [Paenalcaligenes niemegkensis]